MEDILHFACSNAHLAPIIIFALFLLSGLNLPISEDLLLITGGALASTCLPHEAIYILCWLYAGSICAAWETYWIGRYFGPKLYDFRLFKYIVTPQRIKKLHHYYEKFGVFTFIVGRFCPGGVRNALFLTAGLGKMPFPIFMLRDAFAACFSVSIIFSIGFYFGENYALIEHYFHLYSHFVLGFLVIGAVIGGIVLWCHKAQRRGL